MEGWGLQGLGKASAGQAGGEGAIRVREATPFRPGHGMRLCLPWPKVSAGFRLY